MSARTSLLVRLAWHSAGPEHRPHLSAFCCTLPDHGYFDEEQGFVCHDFPWELEVQEFIRGIRGVHPPEFLLVGYDDEGLAAVISLRVATLDRHCFIQAIGIAQRASGNGLAREAIERVPQVMSKYGITEDFIVTARIDSRNVAAKSAFASSGFEHIGAEHGFELWARQY